MDAAVTEEPLFVKRKRSEWERAFAAASGMHLEIEPDDTAVVRNQEFSIDWKFFDMGSTGDSVVSVDLFPKETWKITGGAGGSKTEGPVTTGTLTVKAIQPDLPPWTPPGRRPEDWIDHTIPNPSHTHEAEARLDALVHSRGFGRPNLELRLTTRNGEQPFSLSETARIGVTPDIEFACVPGRVMLPHGSTRQVEIRCQIQNRARGEARLRIVPEQGPVEFDPPSHDVWLPSEDAVDAVTFRFTSDENSGQRLVFQVRDMDGAVVAEDWVETVPLDVRTAPDLLVGIVKSYDDTLESALTTLDVPFELLDRETLLRGELDRYDTILVDIRAYLVREDLRRGNQRLLDYAKRGGAVVLFYQKVFEWNANYGNPPFAPYPLEISRNRVTVETAPITLLRPEHPLLAWPNRLQPEDWDGWVQERGLYFAGAHDAAFEPLLASNDPGERPLDGGYLAARYGDGWYVYTAYVWYRQLRAGIPGSFRALANMVSLPKYPGS